MSTTETIERLEERIADYQEELAALKEDPASARRRIEYLEAEIAQLRDEIRCRARS